MRHDSGVQIDLEALPDDPDILQRMLREVVPELRAENEKLLLLSPVQRSSTLINCNLSWRTRSRVLPLHVIGDDRSEMLDLVPAQLRVKVVCRPRYGCRACEGTVVQAPAPERPIDGGMATEALVAHVVVSKFCDSRVSRTHRQRWRCGAM